MGYYLNIKRAANEANLNREKTMTYRAKHIATYKSIAAESVTFNEMTPAEAADWYTERVTDLDRYIKRANTPELHRISCPNPGR